MTISWEKGNKLKRDRFRSTNRGEGGDLRYMIYRNRGDSGYYCQNGGIDNSGYYSQNGSNMHA